MKYFLVRLNLILLLLVFSHTSYAAITSSIGINITSKSQTTQLQVRVLSIDQSTGLVKLLVEKNHSTQTNNNYSFLADGTIGMYRNNSLFDQISYKKGDYNLTFYYKVNLLACEKNNIEFKKIGDDTIKTPIVTLTNNPASCEPPNNQPNNYISTEKKLDAITAAWKTGNFLSMGTVLNNAVDSLDYYRRKTDKQPVIPASYILNSKSFSLALNNTLKTKILGFNEWFKNNWWTGTNKWLPLPTIKGTGDFPITELDLFLAMKSFKFETNAYVYAQTYYKNNRQCVHYYTAIAKSRAFDNYQFDYSDTFYVFSPGELRWIETNYRPYLYFSEWATFYNKPEYLTSSCF